MSNMVSIPAGGIGLMAECPCLTRLANSHNGASDPRNGIVWDASTDTWQRCLTVIPCDAQTPERSAFEDFIKQAVMGSMNGLTVDGQPGFGRNAIKARDSLLSSPKGEEVLGSVRSDVVYGTSSFDGGTGFAVYMGSVDLMDHGPDWWVFGLPPLQARHSPLTPIPSLTERIDIVGKWVSQGRGCAVLVDTDWMAAIERLGASEAIGYVREGGYEALATAGASVAHPSDIGSMIDRARWPLLELFHQGFQGDPWSSVLPRRPDPANMLRLMAGKWVCLTVPFRPIQEVPSAQEILRHAAVPMTDFNETAFMVVVGTMPLGDLCSQAGSEAHSRIVNRFYEETGKKVELFLIPQEQVQPAENRWWAAIFMNNPPRYAVAKINLMEGS